MGSRFSSLDKLLSCLGAIFGLLLSPSFSLAQNITAQIWNELGVDSATGGGISNDPVGVEGAPDMAINPVNGDIYLAWASGNEEIFVLRWNESEDEWVEVGAGSATGGGISQSPELVSSTPAIAVRPTDGNVFVVWRERLDQFSSQDDIFAAQFNGVNWVRLGAANGMVSNSPGMNFLSTRPKIILSTNNATVGLPIVAWEETVSSSGNNVNLFTAMYVRRWTGLTWEEMGVGSGSAFPMAPAGFAAGINEDSIAGLRSWAPSLILDGLGNPAVVFVNAQILNGNVTYRHGIHIRRFTGNGTLPVGVAWADVGGSVGSDPGSEIVPLFADRIAVAGSANGQSLYVAIDLHSTGGGFQGTLVDLRAILWTGNGWSQRGLLPISQSITPNIPSLGLMNPSMDIDSQGQLVVAWIQNTSVDENNVPIVDVFGFPLRSEIYVRRSSPDSLGDVAWFEIGAGSATAQGISATVGLSVIPVLKIQRFNDQDWAVVAWQDEAGPANLRPAQIPQIYVRRANILPSPAPVIISALVQEARVGQPFDYRLEATGNPHTLEATGLPDGLVFDSANGRISGAPTQSGTFQITLRATNNQGTGSAILELTVLAQAISDLFNGLPIDGFPGWRTSPWYLNYNVDFWPWIYHDEHGWQFVLVGAPQGTIFVWDPGLDAWLFFTENTYRWMFMFGENAGWIWAFDDNTPNRRFFQRLDDGSLISVP